MGHAVVTAAPDAGAWLLPLLQVTIQQLIGAGLDPQLENNPYLCFVYTSFQVGPRGRPR